MRTRLSVLVDSKVMGVKTKMPIAGLRCVRVPWFGTAELE